MSIYVRDADGNRQKIAGVGLPGPAGKSAYQYAVEGGFSGTEEEFKALVGIRSNPNLLDNANFLDPINQRGQTEYIGFVYTIDRWVTEGATIKVGDDGLQLENPSEGAVQFVTNFEASRLIDNQVYTAAILAKNLVGSGIMIIQHRAGMYTYLAANALSEGLTATSGQISTSGIPLLGITIRLEPHSSVKLIAAKLELGPVQTLAHKEGDTWVLNDPPPNKALELAKCQYFQYTPFTNFTGYGDIADGWVWRDTAACFILPLPKMRHTPTLIVDDITKFRISAKTQTGIRSDIVPEAISAPNSIGNCIKLQATVDSSYGMEPGSACELWIDQAPGTVPFLFDANL